MSLESRWACWEKHSLLHLSAWAICKKSKNDNIWPDEETSRFSCKIHAKLYKPAGVEGVAATVELEPKTVQLLLKTINRVRCKSLRHQILVNVYHHRSLHYLAQESPVLAALLWNSIYAIQTLNTQCILPCKRRASTCLADSKSDLRNSKGYNLWRNKRHAHAQHMVNWYMWWAESTKHKLTRCTYFHWMGTDLLRDRLRHASLSLVIVQQSVEGPVIP